MNNKIIKILIPIIAVVVIFESIILVSNLEKNTTSTMVSDITPTETMTEEKVNSFDVNFSTNEVQMEVGKKYQVSVKLIPKDNYSLNALDLYVKYDQTKVTVSNLISSKELVTPDLLKVSDKKSVIAMNYLFADKEGAIFTKDKEVNLLTFTVTPKVATNMSTFEISTGDSEGDSVTMFVDKNTSKKLFFTSNKLEVLLKD